MLTRERARRDGADRQCRHGRAHLHRMGQGRHRHARPDEGRRAGARHAELPAPRPRSPAAALRQATIRSPTLPQDDPAVYEMLSPRRLRRRVPGRKPRADVDAAAAEAAMLLRSRHRGRDRAAGADPGRHGASLSAPARRHRPGALSLARSGAWTGGRAGGGAQAHARRAAVPGTGDADRHHGGEVHARRGRRPAPRHGDLPP